MCNKKIKLHVKYAYINNKIDYYGNQTVWNKVLRVISYLPVKKSVIWNGVTLVVH